MKLFFFILFCSLSGLAQDVTVEALQKMEDEELLTLFNKVENDSVKAEKVARAYLERGKREKDTIKMARGYDRLSRISYNSLKNIKYADSVIALTDHSTNITYPTLAYMIKGFEYEELGDVEDATLNYLKAYELSIKKKNIVHQLYISDRLIFLKSTWGNKSDALKLQKKRHERLFKYDYISNVKKAYRNGVDINDKTFYFENEIESYLNFSYCFLNLKQLDSAEVFLEKGIAKNKEYDGFKHDNYIKYFNEFSIELNYYKKNYYEVINLSNDFFESIKSEKTKQNILYYKGMSQLQLHKYIEGYNTLINSDSIFDRYNLKLYQPYQRILYEKLYEYYSNNDNPKKKLEYLSKLLKADSVIKKNYQYFEPTLIKKYENPELFKEKEQLIEELKAKNIISKTAFWIVLGFLSSSFLVIIIYQRKQQKYKKRFKELMVLDAKKVVSTENNISSDAYDDIKNKLIHFEKENKFLKQSLSINELAKIFKTNQRYLSKVINIEKEKNFNQYLNDLRVSYIFEELKTNISLRKYTINAIAKECGFTSVDAFTRAFYKKYEIKPSYYVKQLNRREDFI